MENSSGLTLAAKIIKAKSQKEKVQKNQTAFLFKCKGFHIELSCKIILSCALSDRTW